jgi:hypothetical protein
VVQHVRGANAVVQQVDEAAVRAVDGLERSFHPGVLRLVEVGNVNVCVAGLFV